MKIRSRGVKDRMDIVKSVRQEVIEMNKSHTEEDGLDIYYDHVRYVVKNALELAKKYEADMEIVELGALLHDIAIILDEGPIEEHHIYGAKITEELLTKYNYPKDKIERVKKCILNHRGSKDFQRNTIEEEIIADSDVIAHFDYLPSLFSSAFNILGLSVREGTDFVKKKLERDYSKLSPRTKVLLEERYKNIMSVLFLETN